MVSSSSSAVDQTLRKYGRGLAQQRKSLGLTQLVLAGKAGVSKRTVERLEAGYSIQLSGFIRILDCLELLPLFKATLSSPEKQPLQKFSTARVEKHSPLIGKSRSWGIDG